MRPRPPHTGKFQSALTTLDNEKQRGEELQELWDEVQQHIGLGYFLASMTTGASKLFALGTQWHLRIRDQ